MTTINVLLQFCRDQKEKKTKPFSFANSIFSFFSCLLLKPWSSLQNYCQFLARWQHNDKYLQVCLFPLILCYCVVVFCQVVKTCHSTHFSLLDLLLLGRQCVCHCQSNTDGSKLLRVYWYVKGNFSYSPKYFFFKKGVTINKKQVDMIQRICLKLKNIQLFKKLKYS